VALRSGPPTYFPLSIQKSPRTVWRLIHHFLPLRSRFCYSLFHSASHDFFLLVMGHRDSLMFLSFHFRGSLLSVVFSPFLFSHPRSSPMTPCLCDGHFHTNFAVVLFFFHRATRPRRWIRLKSTKKRRSPKSPYKKFSPRSRSLKTSSSSVPFLCHAALLFVQAPQHRTLVVLLLKTSLVSQQEAFLFLYLTPCARN